MNKLDAKTHAYIMMGYSEKYKSYRLFDLVKRQIIIIRNVFFDENSLGINLLNDSFGLLKDFPFDIVSDNCSHIPLFTISTRYSNYVHVLTRSSTFFPKSMK
jgi:hypothetical protein